MVNQEPKQRTKHSTHTAYRTIPPATVPTLCADAIVRYPIIGAEAYVESESLGRSETTLLREKVLTKNIKDH